MAWQFAGSLAAVAFLVLLAWRLGFAGSPRLEDEAHARSLAQEVPGGFDAVAVALDQSARAALLRDAAGRIVLVAPSGAHYVARLLAPGTTAIRDGESLAVSARGFATNLNLESAGDWVRAIAALH